MGQQGRSFGYKLAVLLDLSISYTDMATINDFCGITFGFARIFEKVFLTPQLGGSRQPMVLHSLDPKQCALYS